MSLGQSGRSQDADADNRGAIRPRGQGVDRDCARERARLLARVCTDVIPGLEGLDDPAASPPT